MEQYFPVILVVISSGLTIFVVKFLDHLRKRDVEAEAREIIVRAEREAASLRKETELELREERLRQEAEVEQQLAQGRREVHDRERQLDKRQDTLDARRSQLRKQEKMVEANQQRLAQQIERQQKVRQEIEATLQEERDRLHQLTSISPTEAERRLMTLVEKDLADEVGKRVLEHERTVAEKCEALSRDALVTTMQRYAASQTSAHTTNTVDIPNDEMKGRIIGREGRNIRAFEKASGVDVIIDDTPGVVIVSGFDPVRREIGRLSLAKLIEDGRIHPARIEEVVAETEKEMEKIVQRYGEEAAAEADVHGLHPRILALLGRLHFRTSYSQNVLRHSVEVAFLSGMMAEEAGYDGKIARRAGLLHDIGKAADHEMEGGHPKIGADLLKRHNEGDEVVHAAAGHHDDIRIDHPYTVLVAAADACSASRPGARRENLERYIKRMEELERIATSFEGVDQAYAVQAGRELRVLANAGKTTDGSAAKICRDIAQKLENELTYPGEIKVTVIREVRRHETAH